MRCLRSPLWPHSGRAQWFYRAVLRGFGLAIPVMHIQRGSAPTAPAINSPGE